MFQELLLVIMDIGLWSMTGDNIFVSEKSKKIVITDTEQPNTTKPSQMFNRNLNNDGILQNRYLINTIAGLSTLYNTMPAGSNYRKWILDFLKNNPGLRKAGNFNNDFGQIFKK